MGNQREERETGGAGETPHPPTQFGEAEGTAKWCLMDGRNAGDRDGRMDRWREHCSLLPLTLQGALVGQVCSAGWQGVWTPGAGCEGHGAVQPQKN